MTFFDLEEGLFDSETAEFRFIEALLEENLFSSPFVVLPETLEITDDGRVL